MEYDFIMAIGPAVVSSITTVIVVGMICSKLKGFSLVVKSGGRRKRRSRLPGRIEYWRDREIKQ